MKFYLSQLSDAALLIVWTNTVTNLNSVVAFENAVEVEIARRQLPNPNHAG